MSLRVGRVLASCLNVRAVTDSELESFIAVSGPEISLFIDEWKKNVQCMQQP